MLILIPRNVALELRLRFSQSFSHAGAAAFVAGLHLPISGALILLWCSVCRRGRPQNATTGSRLVQTVRQGAEELARIAKRRVVGCRRRMHGAIDNR